MVLASTYPRWAGDPEPGFVHELCRRLTNRFRVIVVGPHAPGALSRELLDGVEVLRYRYAPERWQTLVNSGGIVTNLSRNKWKWLLVPSFILGQAWTAWRVLRRERVGVIHAHWLVPQGLIAAFLQFLSGRAPFLVTSHGGDLYSMRATPLQTLNRFVLRKAQAATVVSRPMRDAVAALGGDVAKVSVMPMGVDMAARFVPDRTVQRSVSELLFVGRLVEKKGLRYLLAAMPAVLRERPDVTLTIAGFGPEEARLRAQVGELGLQHAVHFLGAVAQEDLPVLYQRAAMFVAPFVTAESGDEEGLGLVLVEAIGCGCPVLAGDVAAVGDVLAENWRIDVRDTPAFVARILRMLADVPASTGQANATREILASCLSWDFVASSYADLLQALAAQEEARRNAPVGLSQGSGHKR